MTSSKPIRINIGCGSSPTDGWLNFDGSPSVKLARLPLVPAMLHAIGLLTNSNFDYINFLKQSEIRFADVTRRLPLKDDSCDVVYTSHMLEHISRQDVPRLMKECRRVLRPGGILRIAVPDLRRKAEEYAQHGDADQFMRAMMVSDFWETLRRRRGRMRFFAAGAPSAHKWMYDGCSLVALLESHGFIDCDIVPSGTTRIVDPGNLELHERSNESVYVEGAAP